MTVMNFASPVCFNVAHFADSANANCAPAGREGAETSGRGLALLHRIAGL